MSPLQNKILDSICDIDSPTFIDKCAIICLMRSGINLAEKNGQWKGDKVGYFALHEWVKRRRPRTELCEICYKKPPQDLSNKSGRYLRALSDWEWVCRTCHMIKDGRLVRLHKNNIGRKHTEESKRKIGLGCKGHLAWNKGLRYHNRRTTLVI